MLTYDINFGRLGVVSFDARICHANDVHKLDAPQIKGISRHKCTVRKPRHVFEPRDGIPTCACKYWLV